MMFMVAGGIGGGGGGTMAMLACGALGGGIGLVCSRWTCRIAALALGEAHCEFADEIAAEGRRHRLGRASMARARLGQQGRGAAAGPVDVAAVARRQFAAASDGAPEWADGLTDLRTPMLGVPVPCNRCRVDEVGGYQRRRNWAWPVVGAAAAALSSARGWWWAVPAIVLLPAAILDARLWLAPPRLVDPLIWFGLLALAIGGMAAPSEAMSHLLAAGVAGCALEVHRVVFGRMLGRVVMAPADVTALAGAVLWFGPGQAVWIITGFIAAGVLSMIKGGVGAVRGHTPMLPALYLTIPAMAAIPLPAIW